MNDKILKIMFLVLSGVIAGSYFIGVLYFLNIRRKEKKCICKTYGKIIQNIRKKEVVGSDRHYDTRIHWYFLYEYIVGETKCVRETNVGYLEPRKIGEIVTVYYNPNNCHEAYVEGDNNALVKAIICFCIGIISVIFIYFIYISFL